MNSVVSNLVVITHSDIRHIYIILWLYSAYKQSNGIVLNILHCILLGIMHVGWNKVCL